MRVAREARAPDDAPHRDLSNPVGEPDPTEWPDPYETREDPRDPPDPDGLRRALPAELQSQFTALIRELLLTLRAVIDWYLERLDSGPPEPRIEDIPID